MIEIDPKDKRQFKRAVATLNKILELYSSTNPDIHYHIEGTELQMLTQPHNPRIKRNQNVVCRSPLVGNDG